MSKIVHKTVNSMRLDKWLWCSRFYKTRNLSLNAIKAGKVKFEGNRVKPSRIVKPGECFTIKKGPYTYSITVLALSNNRCSAADAERLFSESEESIKARGTVSSQLKISNAIMPRTRGRPSKRDRRKLIDFTRNDNR
jgi:ribosome-associated heat shock protein Hsp15